MLTIWITNSNKNFDGIYTNQPHTRRHKIQYQWIGNIKCCTFS